MTIAVRYLDGNRLRHCWQAAAHALLADVPTLNRINVFPVPDGDTGTNMGLTVRGVLEALASADELDLPSMAGRVSEAGLDHARGNSGVLLAQFLTGFAGDARQQRLDAQGLSQAFSAGARSARLALSQPQEGTLVTVLDAIAQHLADAVAGGEHDLAVLLEGALACARQALARTTEQLPALKAAGVVDAGARGFVVMLEGIEQRLVEGHWAQVTEAVEASGEQELAEVADEAHRYCTECRILGESLDVEAVRQAVEAMDASSIVVAGHAGKIRVHAHINTPQGLFQRCAEFGRVDGEKADDMLNQWQTVRLPGSQVAVVTDSAADLPDSLLQGWPVQVVPVHVVLDGVDHLDKVGLSPQELFRRLRTDPVQAQTSQPAPGDFLRCYRWLSDHFPAVLSLHVSSRLSGTWQAAVDAAKRVEAGQIEVFDTTTVAAAQGLLVRRAAELASAGCSLAVMLKDLSQLRQQTRTWALVDDIAYGVRGGRVSPRAGTLAKLLRARPILSEVDGQVKPRGALFGQRRLVERLARYVARRLDRSQSWRLLISHADAPEQAELLARELRQRLPSIPSCDIGYTGSAIGVHAGPGTLIVSAQPVCEVPA